MATKRNNESDRAATRCEIGVADGYFGERLAVEATAEGLEFGDGYSILYWDWILSAFHTVHSHANRVAREDHGSDTSNREPIIRT